MNRPLIFVICVPNRSVEQSRGKKGVRHSEINAVLSHEISHIRSNDIRIIGFADLANRLTHGLSLFGQLLLIVNFPLALIGGFSMNWMAIVLLIFAPGINMIPSNQYA
jgi:Zn-dependent protease with chaperone function